MGVDRSRAQEQLGGNLSGGGAGRHQSGDVELLSGSWSADSAVRLRVRSPMARSSRAARAANASAPIAASRSWAACSCARASRRRPSRRSRCRTWRCRPAGSADVTDIGKSITRRAWRDFGSANRRGPAYGRWSWRCTRSVPRSRSMSDLASGWPVSARAAAHSALRHQVRVASSDGQLTCRRAVRKSSKIAPQLAISELCPRFGRAWAASAASRARMSNGCRHLGGWTPSRAKIPVLQREDETVACPNDDTIVSSAPPPLDRRVSRVTVHGRGV